MHALINNGSIETYPYTFLQLRKDNPQVSFPSDLEELPELLEQWGVVPVVPSSRPPRQSGYRIEEDEPELIEDVWTQKWVYIPKTSTEVDLARQEMIQAIKNERDTRSQQGGYEVGGKWYHSDMPSRIQQIGLLMMGTGIPAGLSWKTMDGSFVTMTPTLAQQIFAAAAAKDQALFAYAEVLIGQVNAAGDPEDIDIYTGWPAEYGE
jgi:hypothetical protein